MKVNPKLKREWEWFMFDDFKRVKRALWLARAQRAYREYLYETSIVRGQLWYDVYRKCLDMADKYKEEM